MDYVVPVELFKSINQSIAGDLLNQFEELDMKLSLMLMESTRPFLGSDKDKKSLLQYHNFLLSSEKIKELENMYAKVGSLSL